MNCRYCNKPLSFLQKMAGSQFCSAAHQKAFSTQLDQLAIARLMQSRPPNAEPPPLRDQSSEPEIEPFGTPEAEPEKPVVAEPIQVPEPPAPVAGAPPPSADDDIELPAFLLKGAARKNSEPPAAPKKPDRYSIDDLDDIKLPEFLTKNIKKRQEREALKQEREAFKSASAGSGSDDIVLPPGVARKSKQSSPPPRAEESAPPPFITRQGRGGSRPSGPIIASAAPLITPPPMTEPAASQESVGAEAVPAPAASTAPEPLFDKFVLPAFWPVLDWIPPAVQGVLETRTFPGVAVGFHEPPVRRPELLLEIEAYVQAITKESAKTGIRIPALSGPIGLEPQLLEFEPAWRATDNPLTPLVPLGPGIDLLENAAAAGHVLPQLDTAAVSPIVPQAISDTPEPQVTTTAPLAGHTNPDLGLADWSQQKTVHIDLCGPTLVSPRIPDSTAVAKETLSEPRPLARTTAVIPTVVDSLPDLPSAAFTSGSATPIDAKVSIEHHKLQHEVLTGLMFTAKPTLPTVPLSASIAEFESAIEQTVAPSAVSSAERPADAVISGLTFLKPKPGLLEGLASLAAPILAAAGLGKATKPESSSGPEPAIRDVASAPKLELSAPAIESQPSAAPLDVSNIPALRDVNPIGNLFPFVDQFGVAPVQPEASPVEFGFISVDMTIALPAFTAVPISPEFQESQPPVEPEPLTVEVAAVPAVIANAPYRRRVAVLLIGKDFPASPLLSPLVCDFAAAPMAKVIQK